MQQVDIPPNAEEPFFTIRTTIEGKDYDLAFAWNERRTIWTLTMRTQSGEVLFSEQSLRHGRNFLSRCVSLNRPAGALFCWVNTPADLTPPKLGELGARAGIFYATESELA